MDAATTFLHGELTEEVYMQQPEGFSKCGKENLVCRLHLRFEAITTLLEPYLGWSTKGNGVFVIPVCVCFLVEKEIFS